ncbi:MAG: hypothetical protein K2I47_05150, partial [Odoribacter sp.]|nr:hypothetical protein [Odoribacter sp.]
LKKAGWGIMALFLFACGDSDLLKFDNLEGVKNWEPDYQLQLAYANYDVWKLIEQSDNGDTTLVREGDQIFIRHFQKDIVGLEVGKVIKLPEDIAHFFLKTPVPDTVVGQPLPKGFNFFLPEDSVSIAFEEGSLTRIEGRVSCRHELLHYTFGYKVKVEFTNVFLATGGQLFFEFSPNAEAAIESQDVIFDMASAPNQIKWKASIEILEEQTVDTNVLNIGIWFKDFSFTRVEGMIKPQEVEIDEGEFNMDVEFWDNFDGSFNFANPKVDLTVRNQGLGVPVQMDMDFVAYGENGKSVLLTPKNNYKPEFEGWIPDGGEVVETQSYDTTNSNIAELLSLPPKEKITYGGKIIVSPDSTHSSVILNTGSASVDAYVEIPLYLSVKNLLFRDTIDDINISDADKIKEAQIIVRANNQIPLGLGSGHLYLLDKEKNCIDSVKIERFLDAPEIDADGNVIPSEGEKETPPIVLSQDNILHLNDTKYILVLVEATTSDEGKTPVVIKADAALELKLILAAKLNLEDVF